MIIIPESLFTSGLGFCVFFSSNVVLLVIRAFIKRQVTSGLFFVMLPGLVHSLGGCGMMGF